MTRKRQWDWPRIFVPSTELSGSPSCPEREFVFTETDIADFSARLLAEFPNARFIEDPRSSEFWEPEREPAHRVCRTLSETNVYDPNLVFDPDWEPAYEWRLRYDGAPPDDFRWFRTTPYTYPDGTFNLSRNLRFDASGLSRSSESSFFMRLQPRNKEHARLARRVMRILLEGATNKVEIVAYPSMRVRRRIEKGWPCWIGPDAKRQCLENPNRLLLFWEKDDGTVAEGVRPLP